MIPKFTKTTIPFTVQFDYSVAFVEAGLEYLKKNGTIAYVITSKIVQSLYAGGLRKILLNQSIKKLIDYSYYSTNLFSDVSNYPLIFSVNKSNRKHLIDVIVYNSVGQTKEFKIPQNNLSLYENETTSPWVIAPQDVRNVIKTMQMRGPLLGNVYEVARGVVTSLNDIYIVKRIISFRGILAKVELEDGSTTEIESALLCGLLRGDNIDPFSYNIDNFLIFPHNTVTG